MDAEAHRRQHCTGGCGTAEWQHREGRQPFLRSRGAGLLPAGARVDRHSSVSHEHGRAQKTLAIFAVGATTWCDGDDTSGDEKRRREERTRKRGDFGRRIDASSGERERTDR